MCGFFFHTCNKFDLDWFQLFFVAIFRVLFNTIRFVVKADVGAVKNILLGAFFMFRGKIH